MKTFLLSKAGLPVYVVTADGLEVIVYTATESNDHPKPKDFDVIEVKTPKTRNIKL